MVQAVTDLDETDLVAHLRTVGRERRTVALCVARLRAHRIRAPRTRRCPAVVEGRVVAHQGARAVGGSSGPRPASEAVNAPC